MTRGKVIVLGSGGSMGTPVLGCSCAVCLSENPKNRRLRSSLLLEIGSKKILIDASPDVRFQGLHYNIDHLDAIALTHYHEDHIGGLNDLRPFFFFNKKKKLPVIASESTVEVLKLRFGYLMERFDWHVLEEQEGRASLAGIDFQYVSYSQRGVQVLGYRIGNFAYITDIKEYSPSIFAALEGVETLIVSVIHKEGSPMHFSLEEGIAFGKKVGAKECYFTHLAHEIEHEEIQRHLPEGFFLGYDGLELITKF